MNYKLQKENNRRVTEESGVYIEADNVEDVKEFLKEQWNANFVGYSALSNTIYYTQEAV